jgi:hypothetical protein
MLLILNALLILAKHSKLDYIDEGWEGAGRTAVHKQI